MRSYVFRGDAAKFQKSSIFFEKYNFGFRSIFFGPISVHLCNFHRCFGLGQELKERQCCAPVHKIVLKSIFRELRQA